VCGACAATLAGCGNSDGRVPISGTVTYLGQPFSNASIAFYPATGRPVMAAISDGQYAVELAPGDYKVTVNLGVNLPEGWKEGDPVPPQEMVLPRQYSNVLHTPLSATVADGESEPVDFDLK
jgi:hypothetical protein